MNSQMNVITTIWGTVQGKKIILIQTEIHSTVE
jgi:hypothetical protein